MGAYFYIMILKFHVFSVTKNKIQIIEYPQSKKLLLIKVYFNLSYYCIEHKINNVDAPNT